MPPVLARLGAAAACAVALALPASPALAAGGAPVSDTAPTISGSTTPGSTLSCSTGSWTNNPTGFTYSFTRDGSPVFGSAGHPEQYQTTANDSGRTFQCLVAAINDEGASGGQTSSNSITLTGDPVTTSGGGGGGGGTPSGAPFNQAQPYLTYNPGTGFAVAPSTFPVPNEVYCDKGAWSDPAATFAYSWYKNGAVVPGATGNHVSLTSADAGATVGCRVVATANGVPSGETPSNTVVVAGGAPVTPPAGGGGAPQNTTAPSISSSTLTTAGGVLTCDKGAWSGSPTGYTYSFTRDGSQVFGNVVGSPEKYQTDATDDLGRTFECVVAASNDQGGSGGVRSSNSVTFAGAPVTPPGPVTSTPFNTKQPVLTWNSPSGWAIAPSPFKGSRVYCDTGSWSDPAATFDYSWFVNGSPVAGQTSNNFALASTDGGKRIECRVVAKVGSASSSPTPSNTVVVDNAAASIASRSAHGFVIRVKAPAPAAKMQFAGADHRVAHTLRYATTLRVTSLKTYKFIRFVSSTGKVGAWSRVK